MKDTNMKCTEIRELLLDLAAGVSSTAPEVNAHVGSCTDCAAKLNEFRKMMALLDEWQAPEPSLYFDVRLRARLREEAAKQPSRWFAWIRRPAMAVSLAVALVAGVTIWMGRKVLPEPIQPGTAVSDLQTLDKNLDMFSDSDSDSPSDLLDDLQVQQDVNANP